MTSRRPVALLFTCEHGGNDIPAAYRAHFRGATSILASHRGWDPGALELAKRLAAAFKVRLHQSTTSRLLVELNRSLHHHNLFSQYTRTLDRATKAAIISAYYEPYRQSVHRQIAKLVKQGQAVLHLSIHSFTPEMNGEVRNADIGLLYDPSRTREKTFCAAWRTAMLAADPRLRVRKNYPYLGTADGFTTSLRAAYPDGHYAGVELEVNQRYPLGDKQSWRRLQDVLIHSLRNVVVSLG